MPQNRADLLQDCMCRLFGQRMDNNTSPEFLAAPKRILQNPGPRWRFPESGGSPSPTVRRRSPAPTRGDGRRLRPLAGPHRRCTGGLRSEGQIVFASAALQAEARASTAAGPSFAKHRSLRFLKEHTLMYIFRTALKAPSTQRGLTGVAPPQIRNSCFGTSFSNSQRPPGRSAQGLRGRVRCALASGFRPRRKAACPFRAVEEANGLRMPGPAGHILTHRTACQCIFQKVRISRGSW